MSNELEQILRPAGRPRETHHPRQSPNSGPEVILAKDHPHLILPPHHPMTQLQQPDAGLDAPQPVVPEKTSAGRASESRGTF